jgi:hypothetical protein
MCEIERALRRGASTPYTKYKERVGSYVLRIQQALGTYNVLSSSLDEHHNEHIPHPAQIISISHDKAATSASENGTSSFPLAGPV